MAISGRHLIGALRVQPFAVKAIWAVLAFEFVSAIVTWHPGSAVFAFATFALTLVPIAVTRRLGIVLPPVFYAIIVVFIFASIFLGEVGDFYERFWWWDLVLHGTSALVLGLLGFVLVFMLFEGDRYAAPPWALGVITFCVAMAVGVLWEIFEFGMDQAFGLTMQKSGLPDTMSDLIIDAVGAAIGGLSGFLYLLGKDLGGTRALIDAFVTANRGFYRLLRDRIDRGNGKGR